MGSVLGARQVEVLGTQVLDVGVDELRSLYARAFGKPF
jgi:hypothetical protein